jgi:Bacteriophage tail sheath protein
MPNLGPFKHGVSWQDVPTSVIAPVPAYPGMNVVVGCAPLHLRKDGKDFINKPRIYNRYEDAVAELGYSDDWDTYDICEHMDAVFVEFGVFPVVYIAVNDPEVGKTALTPKQVTLVDGQVDTEEDLIAWSIVVKDTAGTLTYAEGTDYTLSLSKAGTWIITRLPTGTIPTDTSGLTLSGDHPGDASAIDATEIIGGIDINTGARTGLEAIEYVFPHTARVPGVIICPKWSHDPLVASAMEAKSENINGCFACTCLIDVDTSVATGVQKIQDVNQWKNDNNIVFPRQECLFGKPALIGTTDRKVFHFASQQGPLIQWTDTYRGNDLPFYSPSNKNLRMNALLLDDGTELDMNLLDANMLNGQGVVTALNWIGGWKSWGNRTAAYPANTDVKDMFIPVRRTFDFVGNTIVLTIWQKVDEPGNRRLIDAVINSLQLWLDGLSNQEALLGARIEFRHDENPTTEILNGHYTFHVYIAVPTPAEWLDFRIEYWVPYIQNLWPDESQAAAA